MTEPSPPPASLSTMRSVEHRVTEDDVDERADIVLGRRVPALSRRQARSLGRAGALRIDGRRSPPSTRVREGQVLSLELGERRASPAIEARLEQLEVLASTPDFIYINKPAGVHMVALTPDQPGVLATAVAERWPECAAASEDPREGGAIHRLDRPTSGVVAFARSREAWQRARQAFADEKVRKHYLALGRRPQPDSDSPPQGGDPLRDVDTSWPPADPPEGLLGWILAVDPLEEPSDLLELGFDPGPDHESLSALSAIRVRAPLGRARGGEGMSRCAVRLDGRRATSLLRPLARTRAGEWLFGLRLETGRRHQARVHLAYIGMPIVGDHLYGSRAPSTAGEAMGELARAAPPAIHLHAYSLDLSDVFPGESRICAPPPPGFWPPDSHPD